MSLRDEFKDTDYRRAYAESFANTVIATQIRLLRGSMNQTEFANLVGVKQSRISAMEDENYSAWSTKTLKKLARGKDVAFLGMFVSFGEILDRSRLMSAKRLTPVSFANDPAFGNAEVPSNTVVDLLTWLANDTSSETRIRRGSGTIRNIEMANSPTVSQGYARAESA